MTPDSQSRDFRANHAPLSPAVVTDGRLLIDLGGTVVEIESASDSWLSEVCDRYGPFVRQNAVADIKIAHTLDETTMMKRHGYLSVLESDGSGAQIASAKGTEILDGVVRALLPSIIAPDLMVHGALLSDGKCGFLCCGVSGSGKSTIASLFPEAALCDELARIHEGAGGLEVRSLPFWVARPASVALSAVFMLEHGDENRRIRLGQTMAIKALRRHVYWPVEDPQSMQETSEVLMNICRDIPVYRLAFLPERSVWTLMTDGL